MNESEKEFLYWLTDQEYLGAVSIMELSDFFGSFRNVYAASGDELKASGILSDNQTGHLLAARSGFDECRREYLSLPGKGISAVTFTDEGYPARLREIAGYPPMLFFKGSLPADDRPTVAIVGARACSRYGEDITSGFASVLARENVQIISGLALGIDAAAHAGALKEENGSTFAVMGCGINNCYPQRNYPLYAGMQKNGGVLTEFSMSGKPLRGHFPMRNRIISGLADAVLITEARKKSGSLITAQYALDQGKEIFALPGRITDPLSEGCNALIADGARPALSPDDILEYLQVKHSKKLTLRKKNTGSLAKIQKMVYNSLDSDPKHLDEIAADTGLSAAECLEVLLSLQLEGFADRTSGQYYSRKV